MGLRPHTLLWGFAPNPSRERSSLHPFSASRRYKRGSQGSISIRLLFSNAGLRKRAVRYSSFHRHRFLPAYLHRRAFLPARLPPSGPRFDDIVTGFNDIQVMLDNQHGVTALSELTQNGNQSFTVRHMQTRCRFIQHIEGFSGRCTGKLSRQLHALSLAAGECGRGLSQTAYSPSPHHRAFAAYG